LSCYSAIQQTLEPDRSQRALQQGEAVHSAVAAIFTETVDGFCINPDTVFMPSSFNIGQG
jgi:hypothetical protein